MRKQNNFLIAVISGSSLVMIYLFIEPLITPFISKPIWLSVLLLFILPFGLAGFFTGLISGKTILKGALAGFLAGVIGVTFRIIISILMKLPSDLTFSQAIAGLLELIILVTIITTPFGIMGSAIKKLQEKLVNKELSSR